MVRAEPTNNHTAGIGPNHSTMFMGAIWWGTRGRVPPLFQTGGHNMPCQPHFFLFRFCIWKGFKNKSYVCYVLCEELFMSNGRPHIANLMLKQSFFFCTTDSVTL